MISSKKRLDNFIDENLSIENINPKKITYSRYSQISFKGVKKVDELKKLLEQDRVTIYTKNTIHIILNYKKTHNIESNDVGYIWNEILAQLRKSSNLVENLLFNHIKTLNIALEYNQSAYTDLLTGLSSRRAAQEKIDKLEKQGSLFSALILDIDNFKRINDTFGHDVGDVVLKEMGKILKECGLRENDIVARWGGEEFIILLDRMDNVNAGIKAEHIRSIVEKKLINSIIDKVDSEKICKNNKSCKFRSECQNQNKMCFPKKITVSIGYGTFKKDEGNEHFIKRIDSALYKAKETGRNKIYNGMEIDNSIENEKKESSPLEYFI